MSDRKRTWTPFLGWAAVAAMTIITAALRAQSAAAEAGASAAGRVFRAGAHAVDITPEKFPVIVNGGMLEQTATAVVDPLHARCLVLDDGTTEIAIAVVDSCMVPRAVLDKAKALAQEATGIATNRMLISATHAHSAPAVAGCLGSDVQEDYAEWLPGRIAKGIELAQKNLPRRGSVGRSARTPRTCSAGAT
ncbi:MAG: hypothetical protein A2V98_25140 [Planctomycetes bacterium RBG_16_64_12]|nr:MAG: hypothetical protein A2V98_25140 [Planctomycetes bacterium RBG_16_64_12]